MTMETELAALRAMAATDGARIQNMRPRDSCGLYSMTDLCATRRGLSNSDMSVRVATGTSDRFVMYSRRRAAQLASALPREIP
jgi:hypothetical protein